MRLRDQASYLNQVIHSGSIARRYFVVNGFDGALTMLGIIVGFYHSDYASVNVIISACLGAAVALGVSGLSSAYLSEAAERKVELRKLEDAMVTDLSNSAHGLAARVTPFLIALVNGFAPFILSLIIIIPLWIPSLFEALPLNPLEAAMAIASLLIFLLGVFLGKVSGHFWLVSGLRTLFIALVTGAIILFLAPG